MPGWTTAALGDVAVIERRGVDPSSIEDDTVYLGLEHIESGGRIIGHSTVGASGVASTKFRFGPEHVLFGKLRPYLGKIAAPDFAGVCSTDILPLRPGRRLDRQYLLHFLRQPSVVSHAASRATGANLPRLSPSELAAFKLPLPLIEEQRRIAAILDHVAGLMRRLNDAGNLRDRLGRAVFTSMFGGSADRWPLKPFAEVAPSVLGKMLDSKRGRDLPQFPYLRNVNVRWHRVDTKDLLTMGFSSADQVKFALRRGDLLICEGGEPGRCAVWEGSVEPMYFQKALHRARPVEGIARAKYLAFAIEHMVATGALSDHVSQATIAHLTGEKLKAMLVPVPPLFLQDQFVARIDAIDQQGQRYEQRRHQLEKMLNALQARAFSGRL